MPAFSVRATVLSPSPDMMQSQIEQRLRFLHPRVRRSEQDALEVSMIVVAETPDAADDYARSRLIRASEADHLSIRLADSEVSPHLGA